MNPVRINVICVGTELLLGHTINTNLAFIGDLLHRNGYALDGEFCIPDNPDTIKRTLTEVLRTSDIVITVGGLGPTRDDITRNCVAELLEKPLACREDVHQEICEYLNKRSVTVPSSALRTQAMVPEGAEPMINRNGTAPGLWIDYNDKTIIMLPGPPREFTFMVETQVLPRILKAHPANLKTTTVRTTGIGESVAEERVEELLKDYPQIQRAYCAKPFMVDIRLTALPDECEILKAASDLITAHFADAVLPEAVETLEAAVVALLTENNKKVSTAESCTGGLISAALTAVDGSSACFPGSMIVYSNEQKSKLLGVNPETLEQYGAVSEQTAGEMLDGLKHVFGTDAGISVTGIAGPTGGTPEKPVGLVYIGTMVGDAKIVRSYKFPGNRENVRFRTLVSALNQLRKQLLQSL